MNDTIDYTQSYVAYLDALGFTEIVMKEDENEESKLRLASYFARVGELTGFFNDSLKDKVIIIAISDSIIISVPINSDNENSIDNLRQLCIVVGIFQCDLALQNIWLRGGISFGKSFIDLKKVQVVGQAYIKAYKLEKNHAKWPRVILDPALIQYRGFNLADDFIAAINKPIKEEDGKDDWDGNILYNWKYSNGENVMTIEKDVALFIDYMSYFCILSDQSLLGVANNIQKNFYQKNEIYTKYRWVGDYLRVKFKEIYIAGGVIQKEVEDIIGQI
jgi:hypothetical protein